jgi:hypothetical protein
VERYACYEDFYCSADPEDCTAKEDAVFACRGRGGCEDPLVDGQNGPKVACETAYGTFCDEAGCTPQDSCECSGPCKDGHSATISCEINQEEGPGNRFKCKCFFDGEFVGKCTDVTETCLVESSCCTGFFGAD